MAQLLGLTGLVPVAIGMWVWTGAMVLVVFGTSFLAEREDGVEAGSWEGNLAECRDGDGTPQPKSGKIRSSA